MNVIKDFLLQLSLMATLIFTFQNFWAERLDKSNYIRIIHSALFGISIILAMIFRAHIYHQFYLDFRIVPLLLGTLYGGWESGLFLSAVVIFYRTYLGIDLGFYTTVLALVLGMPAIIAFHKLFVKVNKNMRLRIAVFLSMFYNLAGFISVCLVEGVSPQALQAATIEFIITAVIVLFFVSLNEMIAENIRRNQQLQSEVMEAELAFLRSQIKPHFLYNALNSIAALCTDEPRLAEKLILDLSQVLRRGFDFRRLDTLSTLESELELVNAYLNIEKARFGGRLCVEYDVDSELDIWIPPLVLQPLVENSVRHGLMSSLKGGTVKISIKRTVNNSVRFVIEDNGCGMSAKKQEEVLKPIPEKKGVGLWNISQRIKLHYGKTLHIESIEGIGTKICFEIPT